jgi:hypothetical protein
VPGRELLPGAGSAPGGGGHAGLCDTRLWPTKGCPSLAQLHDLSLAPGRSVKAELSAPLRNTGSRPPAATTALARFSKLPLEVLGPVPVGRFDRALPTVRVLGVSSSRVYETAAHLRHRSARTLHPGVPGRTPVAGEATDGGGTPPPHQPPPLSENPTPALNRAPFLERARPPGGPPEARLFTKVLTLIWPLIWPFCP